MNLVNENGKVIIALAEISAESRDDYEKDLGKCPEPGNEFNVKYTIKTYNAFCTACNPSRGVTKWSTNGCYVSVISSLLIHILVIIHK